MAGVPHSISALWTIADEASVDATECFYKALKGEDGRLHFEKTAEALRSATIELRAKGCFDV
jgi:CHAT domain-containing protein